MAACSLSGSARRFAGYAPFLSHIGAWLPFHRDLGVLGAPGGPGVLPLHPRRRGAFLHITGLVDDQHRTRVTQVPMM